MERTLQQKQAIETTVPYVCVDAGAGSGKTSVLIARVIHLIQTRAATLDQIVAITFTEAAATEMKIRLRREFRRLAPADDPQEMSRWRQMERWLEFARINTIHSFCGALLRENALRIGIDPDFAVLPEAEAALLRIESVTQCIHRLLDARDARAVHAAAEFGVKKLIETADSLIAKGLLMEGLAERFPLRDPALLAERWEQMCEQAHQEMLVALANSSQFRRMRGQMESLDGACTKPSDGREVLRLRMIQILAALPALIEAPAITAALQEIAALKIVNHRAASWPDPALLEMLKEVQERVREAAKSLPPPAVDREMDRAAAELTCDVYHVYEQCAAEYAGAKRIRAAMDFEDLLARALQVLRDDAEVRERTARGIRHLLIDEFQDTDSTQLAIARLIAGVPGGPHVFIVGDAKQSIYDFRGAEVELFQDERQRAHELIPLHKNFRTLPGVLEFVNDFFAQNGGLEAVAPEYPRLEPNRAATEDVRIEFLIPDAEDKKRADEWRHEEARLIASRIHEFCREGAAPCVCQGDAFRPARHGDIAILFRSMTSLYAYEEVLRRWAIPFQAVGGAGFYTRQEVIDLRNLLALLVDSLDEPALFGFLRGPFARLSDDELAALAWDTGLIAAWRGIPGAPVAPATQAGLARARALLDSLRGGMTRPLPAFLRTLLERTGYEAILLSQFLGVQKAQNIRKLLALAEDFGRTRQPSLPAFIHYLELLARQEFRESDAAVESGGSAVTLMTIHKSKGLEFPIVFVPDLSRQDTERDSEPVVAHRAFGLVARVTGSDGDAVDSGIRETIKRARKEKARAESARILYVAMTRARDVLVLSGGPDVKENTWMAQFNAQYKVAARNDGDVFTGAGWAARVRRKPAVTPARSVRPAPEAIPSLGALTRQAAPVTPVPGARRVFSISELLNALFARDREEAPETGDAHLSASAPSGRTAAIHRGTLVHRMFEWWRPPAAPPVARVLQHELLTAEEHAARVADLEAVAARFLQSPLAAPFASAADTALRECPFMLRIGDALVSGVIDLVLPDGTIIDYKTGRPEPHALARYEMQLRLYAIALRALHATPPAGAAIYYVDSGKIEQVGVGEDVLGAALRHAEEAIAALCRKSTPAPAAARGTAFAAE